MRCGVVNFDVLRKLSDRFTFLIDVLEELSTILNFSQIALAIDARSHEVCLVVMAQPPG